MIEILNFKTINKGAFIGSANIKVVKWNLILNKVAIFSKDNRRWISLPQEVYEDKGEKKYYSLVKFEDPSTMNKFQEAVLLELDIWRQKNESNETVENSQNQELPF
jgi:hypothetical protein